MNRRHFVTSLSSCVAALASGTAIAESSLRVSDLTLEAGPGGVRRARLLAPPSAGEARRVLVLLHGRGEVGNESLALRAWQELYGLSETDARLKAGRVAPDVPEDEMPYTLPARLKELQRELDARPYRGMAFVCPVTPNPNGGGSREQTLQGYAEWIEKQLLPAVRRELPGAQTFGIDGCSMGGLVALEVFLRAPHLFGSFGMVQGAFGAFRAPGFAERLAQVLGKHGARPVHLETSTRDAFLKANEALARGLDKRGVEFDLEVPRGPHNQPFLRQMGTLLMLRWHDAALVAGSRTVKRAP